MSKNKLNIVVGDLWDFYPERWAVIPTNGIVKRNGEAVMGVGLALQAKERFPLLPKMLGEKLARAGNNVYVFPEYKFVTFPTKHHFRELADLALIERSAMQLWQMVSNTGNQVQLVSGLVGMGASGRSLDEVAARVAKYFNSMDLLLVRRPYRWEVIQDIGDYDDEDLYGLRYDQ